jgi:hypothetical protein
MRTSSTLLTVLDDDERDEWSVPTRHKVTPCGEDPYWELPNPYRIRQLARQELIRRGRRDWDLSPYPA